MKEKEININALNLLENQEWSKAQKLFFYNVKINPSYQTYNNLGFYLVSEGIQCKNGKTRNATKQGIKYIVKSMELKATSINLFSMVKAIDYQLRDCTADKKTFYKCACDYLEKALKLKYSDILQYNYLRFLYLLDPNSKGIVDEVRSLVNNLVSVETVSLYLEILRIYSLKQEGIRCIEKYNDILDEADLLISYAKFGLYEKGYEVCDSVMAMYSMDQFIASAVIECCLNTLNFEKAKEYSEQIKEIISNEKQSKKTKIIRAFEKIITSKDERTRILSNYSLVPPIIDSCCYFGCPIHKTEW